MGRQAIICKYSKILFVSMSWPESFSINLFKNAFDFQSLARYRLSRIPEMVLKFESYYETIQIKAIELIQIILMLIDLDCFNLRR